MYQWIPIIDSCLRRKTFQKQSRKCRQCATCTLTKHQSDQLVWKERLPKLVCGCEQRTLQKERRLLDRAQASRICANQLRAHSHWRTHIDCRDSSQAREAYLHYYTNAAALLSDRQKQHTRCSNKCTFTVHTFTAIWSVCPLEKNKTNIALEHSIWRDEARKLLKDYALTNAKKVFTFGMAISSSYAVQHLLRIDQ